MGKPTKRANNGGTLNVTNSTFSGNSAELGGGALYNFGGTARLTNCTLSENGAAIFNGCVPILFDGCFYGSVTLTNTIIAESAGLSCVRGPISDGGHNLQFPGTSCGATIQSLDPLLDPAGLTDNGGPTQTIALLPGSPAINAGDSAICANPPVNGLDQRGYVRPGTGHTQCSIGAYEAGGTAPEACVGDCDGTGSVTIDELLTLVNIALGNNTPSECPAGDGNQDGAITVEEILTALNAALNGCAA